MKLVLLLLLLGVSACAMRKGAKLATQEPLILCLIDQDDAPLEGAFVLQAGGNFQLTDRVGCVMFPVTRKVLVSHPDVEDESVIDPGPGFRLYHLHRERRSKHRPA